jgi:anti-anti-sigma factor
MKKMDIRETVENDRIVFNVEGEIDGSNADEFELKLRAAAEKTENLVVDLKGLEYVSSAGLRSFLMVQKQMKQQGGQMSLIHVNEEVMEIFAVTGFVKLLNIKEEEG